MRPARLFALVIFAAALVGHGIARRDTGADLRQVDARIRQANNALTYYQDLYAKMDGLIFVNVKEGKGEAYVPVTKKAFSDWASTEIYSGAMTPSDIEAIVSVSTEHKKNLKKGLPMIVGRTQELLKDLEDQQKALAAKLEKERHPQDPGVTLGDEWILDDPVIENHGGVVGSSGTITLTNTQDGKTGSATITFSGIPKRVRDGERIKITMGAEASSPAGASAWINLNCVGKMIVHDDSVFTSGAGKPSGTLEFEFKGGTDAYIQISGGIDPPGRWALVTFKFHKAKP